MLTQALFSLLYRVTKNVKATTYIVAILFFPGVVIHELSHAFMAGALMVPVGEMEFLPVMTEHGIKLGSVKFAKTDPIRRALIGMAPILVGTILLVGILYYYFSYILSQADAPLWLHAIIVYVLFEVGNTMFSSRKDVEGLAPIIIIVILLAVSLYIAHINLLAFISVFLNREENLIFFQQITSLLLLPLVINYIFIIFAKLLHKKFVYK